MDMQWIYNVLLDAEQTVKNQRQEIERLRPKAQAYDHIGKLLDAISSDDYPNSYSVDPAWTLSEAAKEVRAELDRIKEHRVYDPTEHPPGTAGIDRSGKEPDNGEDWN